MPEKRAFQVARPGMRQSNGTWMVGQSLPHIGRQGAKISQEFSASRHFGVRIIGFRQNSKIIKTVSVDNLTLGTIIADIAVDYCKFTKRVSNETKMQLCSGT